MLHVTVRILSLSLIKSFKSPCRMLLSWPVSLLRQFCPCPGSGRPVLILSGMKVISSDASRASFEEILCQPVPVMFPTKLNIKQKHTWKFLLTSVFLSDSICRNFDRRPLIWLSILMIYWKSLCVRKFSTSIDCDMFCTFWKEWNSAALIFPSTTRLKCPPCSAAQ